MASLPTIHMNGTGKETLEREYEAAAEALENFTQKFQSITCHPRDYYVQEDGQANYQKAVNERREIFAKLREIDAYITEVRLHLHDQK